MQNRFTIRPVPTSVDLRRLREYVEDHVTWVDRIAFLPSSSSSSSVSNGGSPGDSDRGGRSSCPSCSSSSGDVAVVAIELNQENYVKRAIDFFGANRTVVLATFDDDGDDEVISFAPSGDVDGVGRVVDGRVEESCRENVEFCITRVAAATREESDELLHVCRSNGKDGDSSIGDDRGCGFYCTKHSGTFHLGAPRCRQLDPMAVNQREDYCVWNGIKILRSDGEGGTGAQLWRGGVLLANYVRRNPDPFRRRAVIELGAGYHGLPSLVLDRMTRHVGDGAVSVARGCSATGSRCGPRRIVVSDSIDEIVESLRRAVELNRGSHRPHPSARSETKLEAPFTRGRVAVDEPDRTPTPPFLEVEQIDFYHIDPSRYGTFDAVIYADCIYSVEQGLALASACGALTGRSKSGPHGEAAASISGGCPSGRFVLGVLPPFRVGVEKHIRAMGDIFGEPMEIDVREESSPTSSLDGNCSGSIRCVQGGNASGYRILKWAT